MAGRIAARVGLTAEQQQELGPEPGAFDTAEARGAGTDHPAGGRWRGRDRDGPSARYMAQDGQHLAQTLARGGCCPKRGGALERCTARGAPGKFTPEQVCAIIAMACEAPEDSDLPISHWSQSEVARQAVKRGIVAAFRMAQWGVFLKNQRLSLIASGIGLPPSPIPISRPRAQAFAPPISKRRRGQEKRAHRFHR